MPVFDAITSGYLILSSADVYVNFQEGSLVDAETKEEIKKIKRQNFQWASYGSIESHPIEQAPLHPMRKEDYFYPKWINPWSIKTPPGYSTLFVQPFHRDSVFTILPGIVDTDTYFAPVNFPFVINDPLFEGLIPKGTPIAQVIPIKREDWEQQLGTEEDVKNQAAITKVLSSKFYDKYKNMFWSKKKYK